MLAGRSGEEVVDLIRQTIQRLTDRINIKDGDLAGVGVCVPGIAGPYRETVWAPNIPGWDELPLVSLLKKYPALKDTPVFADGDRTCCLRGEAMHGNAAGTRNAVFITVGTGIGAGIMVDGHVLSGFSAISGATGWMALERPYKDKFKAMGCFEYYASGDGLSRSGKEYMEKNPEYQGYFRYQDAPPKSEDIFAHYDSGDSLSRFVLNQAIELWGMAVANYVSLFNPEIIIFGGGVFGPAVRFLPDILKEAKSGHNPLPFSRLHSKLPPWREMQPYMVLLPSPLIKT